MNKPTCSDLFEEDGFLLVDRKTDDSWRHGSYVTEVFQSIADNTYWMAKYRRSSDGETNELRDGTAKITEVEPYEVKTTAYRAKE